MITKEEAVDISNLTVINEDLGKQLIQRYIFDRKGKTIIINPIRDHISLNLFHIAICNAKNWYLKE